MVGIWGGVTQQDPLQVKIFEKGKGAYIAFKPGSNLALIACHNVSNQHTVVWDVTAGKVASVINDFGACDGVIYDQVVDLFFTGSLSFKPGAAIAMFQPG